MTTSLINQNISSRKSSLDTSPNIKQNQNDNLSVSNLFEPGNPFGHTFYDQIIMQLQPMELIEPNWDGYGAENPSKTSIYVAYFILLALSINKSDNPPEISPTRTGGISMVWPNCNGSPEIEIFSSGQAILVIEEQTTKGTKEFLELDFFSKPTDALSNANINITNFAKILEIITRDIRR